MSDIFNIQPINREVEIRHPNTEKGLGWIFTLRSPYSDEVKKADREWMNARLAKRKNQLTAEALESAAEAKILAAVSDWKFEGEAKYKGEHPAYSKGLLREVIRDNPWIKEQLDEAMGDAGGFFGN